MARRKTLFTPFNIAVAMVLVGISLYDVHCSQALAATEIPTGLVDTASKQSFVDIGKQVITFVLYSGMILATIVAAIGAVLLLPIIGNNELGKMSLKYGAIVFALCGFFEVIVSFAYGLYR